MTDYRRNRVPGGTCFFTINLLDRRSNLLIDQIDNLRAAIRHVRRSRPFHINAWVVLPEHMRCLLTLPETDTDYSTRLRLIKTMVSKGIAPEERRSSSRAGKGGRGIWLRRFWEHTIQNEADYAAHMDYIHFNPVRHSLTASAAGWPFSTFRHCVALGVYRPNGSVPTLIRPILVRVVGSQVSYSDSLNRRQVISMGYAPLTHPTLAGRC